MQKLTGFLQNTTRPHPISLDNAFPDGGTAVNHGGGDGHEADSSEACWSGLPAGNGGYRSAWHGRISMPEIKTELLFTVALEVQVLILGVTPYGVRRIAQV